MRGLELAVRKGGCGSGLRRDVIGWIRRTAPRAGETFTGRRVGDHVGGKRLTHVAPAPLTRPVIQTMPGKASATSLPPSAMDAKRAGEPTCSASSLFTRRATAGHHGSTARVCSAPRIPERPRRLKSASLGGGAMPGRSSAAPAAMPSNDASCSYAGSRCRNGRSAVRCGISVPAQTSGSASRTVSSDGRTSRRPMRSSASPTSSTTIRAMGPTSPRSPM